MYWFVFDDRGGGGSDVHVHGSFVFVLSARCRWLGMALDGQTDSVKKNRIRLSVVTRTAAKAKEPSQADSSLDFAAPDHDDHDPDKHDLLA